MEKKEVEAKMIEIEKYLNSLTKNPVALSSPYLPDFLGLSGVVWFLENTFV